MDDFRFQQRELYCEQVPLARIAESVGTPAYIYSAATLIGHYDRFARAFAELSPTICYSMKCCGNLHICRLLAARGAGFDVVSGGELFRARTAGADPARIVFAGAGKTDREIGEALDARVGLLNVESESELAVLADIAAARGAAVRAALRINPDVDPRTHRYTTTGMKESKFGVDLERAQAAFDRFGRDPRLRLVGLHLHLGSPVNSIDPYVRALERTLALFDELRSAGFPVDTLDIGGGFGAHYRGDEAPDAAAYAAAIVPLLRGRGLKVILEPGRSIAANAGVLLARVIHVKQSGERRFIILDAGMTELIRPALYEAFHFVWPVRPGEGFVPPARGERVDLSGLVAADVVGPVCETGDFLALDRALPPVQRGDLMAVFSAGAYGMTMASQYNARPRPPEVLVEGERFRFIRRRETYDDLVAPEQEVADSAWTT